MKAFPKFLHVGCGQKHKPQTPFAKTTWKEIRLDINPNTQPDLIGSMTEMRSVEDSSVDAIYSSHNIEHLFPHEVPIALQEFRRVLKPDGFALITCPDMQSVCEIVAKGQLLEPIYMSRSGPIAAIDIIYGHRESIQKGETYMAHRCGFTARSMSNTLTSQGFTSITSRIKGDLNLWTIAGINKDKNWLITRAQSFFPLNHKNSFHSKRDDPN